MNAFLADYNKLDRFGKELLFCNIFMWIAVMLILLGEYLSSANINKFSAQAGALYILEGYILAAIYLIIFIAVLASVLNEKGDEKNA